MNLQAGFFLDSTGALDNTDFARARIFLSEYNATGAVGFVVNRSFGRSLNELEEFRHSAAFPLYDGGPVDREHLFFLHRRPDVITGGTPVAAGMYVGGNFRQAVTGINNRSLTATDIKIFVGYCGWDAGELEAEVEEGSWTVSEGGSEAVFG